MYSFRVFREMCRLVLILAVFPALTCAQTNTAATNAPASTVTTNAAQPAPPPKRTLKRPDEGADAGQYVRYGESLGADGKIDEALAAFDQAVKLNPKLSVAYVDRGLAYELKRDLEKAFADYDKAVQVDPKDPSAYYRRGVAQAQFGHFQEALLDLNTCINLKSDYADAYYNRGHAKYFLGDLPGAQEDITKAIALNPGSPYSYFIRGLARHAQGDSKGAASDFENCSGYQFPFGILWVWIVHMENGDRSQARAGLLNYAAKPELFEGRNIWAYAIISYLLEKLSQDEFLAKANDYGDNHVLCEAWFYIGMTKQFSGDTHGALAAFERAVETDAKDSEEYIEAKRYIAKLQ